MLNWLRSFIGREVIANVPADLERCLDCRSRTCSEAEWQACPDRQAVAAQITAARAMAQARQSARRS